MDLAGYVFLSWFLPLVSVIVQILIIVAFYGIIRHFGNCPTCGRRISNKDEVCQFCGTKRLTIDESTVSNTLNLTKDTSGTTCPSCQSRIPVEAKKCPNCGEKIR